MELGPGRCPEKERKRSYFNALSLTKRRISGYYRGSFNPSRIPR